MTRKENFFLAINVALKISIEAFNALHYLITGWEIFIIKEEKKFCIKREINKDIVQAIDAWFLPALLITLEDMKLLPRTKLIFLINNIKDKERLYKLLYMIVFEKTNPEELSLLLKENKIEMLIEVFDRLEPVPYNRLDLIYPGYSLALARAKRNENERTKSVLAPKSRVPVHIKDSFKAPGNSNKRSTTLGRKYANPNKVRPFVA